jgi:hypothetical protein
MITCTIFFNQVIQVICCTFQKEDNENLLPIPTFWANVPGEVKDARQPSVHVRSPGEAERCHCMTPYIKGNCSALLSSDVGETPDLL